MYTPVVGACQHSSYSIAHDNTESGVWSEFSTDFMAVWVTPMLCVWICLNVLPVMKTLNKQYSAQSDV